MRIKNIQLKNYRCFDLLEIDFHHQMTVLVAPNGQGKTSILDAIKVALWPFVAGFDLGSTTNDVTSIQIEDVRREQLHPHEMDWRLPAEIKATGTFYEDVLWHGVRYRESVKKGTKTKERFIDDGCNLNERAKILERRIFSDEQKTPDDLPMLGYYGTGRLWAQKKLTSAREKADNETLSRTFAYRDCLDPASSYKHFAQWYTRIFKSLRAAQIRNLEKRLQLDANIPYGLIAPVRAVQQATNIVLGSHTGWQELAYSEEDEELVMNHHQQHGQLKVSQLSDGIRNMLALVGDIAYRCYKLNAHLGEDAPNQTNGVVLIDEVDMHLHPSWQQTILTDLSKAFPKLQFIVTTHSPQVLTSIDASCVRLLKEENTPESGRQRTFVEQVDMQTKGVASSDLLARIMGVDPIPDVPEAKWVAEYHALIQQNLHQDIAGQSLRKRLDDHFGTTHPVIRECDRLIRLQAFKQKLPIPKDGD